MGKYKIIYNLFKEKMHERLNQNDVKLFFSNGITSISVFLNISLHLLEKERREGSLNKDVLAKVFNEPGIQC